MLSNYFKNQAVLNFCICVEEGKGFGIRVTSVT